MSELVDIPSFPGYKVTRAGKIYSVKFKKFLKEKPSYRVYPRVILYKNKERRSLWIHRLVAKVFCGLKKGQEVHHKDRNKLNYHADNLQCLSPEEHKKVHKKGLKSKGTMQKQPNDPF